MLICQKCLQKYSDKLIKNGKSSCPILGCGGNIIDVPNNLVESVIQFNKKGYITKFVSTSPCDDTDKFELYIAFERILKEEAKDSVYNKWTLPEGLELRFSVMRMSNNREEDNKYVSPRISVKEVSFENMSKPDIIKKKLQLVSEVSSKIYDFACSL